jgi:dipeptidyl aminopeptidase/acylaminoacyl peptidase
MSVPSGTRFGPYEVLAAIGAGGMGEVYRARDTKLHRDVAIKVLPDLFAADPDRLARFEREAQVLASLNHPNIAHVYGVEDLPPKGGSHVAGSHATAALIMEFVDGEDLSQRLSRGAVPIDEALIIAKQIVDALEAAHEQGIVHRDLKPANIKIRPDGAIKVLDFGLAKALDPSSSAPAAPALENSPTFTSPAAMTRMGVVLGTAAYMAPEQAKGRAVDKRADIWAFGCVFFELLAGRRPFAGDDLTEIIAAVVKDEPSWSLLPPATPPAIRALLRRCLIKDPKQRLRDIGDARLALNDPTEAAAAAPAPAARSAWRTVGLAIGALLLAAGASGATWWWMMRDAPVMPVRRFLLATPPLGGFGQREFSISPDGSRVAYAAAGKLYVWHLSELTPRAVTDIAQSGLGQIAAPFWSPDGTSVAYAAAGRLWRVSLRDGQPTAVCSVKGEVVGGAWRSDGTLVFPVTRGPMYQVPALGGEPSVLIPLLTGQDVDFHQPSVLPDGVSLVYAVHGLEGTTTFEVFAGGARKTVFRAPSKPRSVTQVLNLPSYSPTGHLVFRQDDGNIGVWAVPFSLSRLETTGAPFLVAAGARNPAVAADGTLVYAPTRDGGPTQLVWLRADGTLERRVGEVRQAIAWPALAPDGRRIAFAAAENNTSDIWVLDPDKGSTRITSTPIDENTPVWMPDGRTLAYTCPTDRGTAICAKAADGSGDTRILVERAATPVFSPDGRYMVFMTSERADGGAMLWKLDEPAPRLYLSARNVSYLVGFSADGRYFAYTSFERSEPRIYVRRFPAGDTQWEVPRVVAEFAIWPAGGKQLFAVIGRNLGIALTAIPIVATGDVPAFGVPRTLFQTTTEVLGAGLVITPDGTRILTVQHQESDAPKTGIVVVQNWWADFSGKQSTQ